MEMSRKEFFLIAAFVILLAVFAFGFTDWFKNVPIRVQHSVRPYVSARRPPGDAAGGAPLAYSISFALGNEYELTSVKVVAAEEFATNQNASALWHLVGDAKSKPTSGFAYGQRVPGMKPFITGAQAQTLLPGITYHISVQAGRRKGEHDFTIPAQAAR